MFQYEDNVSDETFFTNYLYSELKEGGIGFWHNREIHKHHIEEL